MTPAITITRHALDRYRERVADLPDATICAILASPVVERAARFGAHIVRLPTGQRIILRGFTVITVLTRDTGIRAMFARLIEGGPRL